jgi:hypothetical protein
MSRAKSAHDLSGLMKYAGRAPWDEAMDEMLSAHLGPAATRPGLIPKPCRSHRRSRVGATMGLCLRVSAYAGNRTGRAQSGRRLPQAPGPEREGAQQGLDAGINGQHHVALRSQRGCARAVHDAARRVAGYGPGNGAGAQRKPGLGQLGQDRRANCECERAAWYCRGALAIRPGGRCTPARYVCPAC